MLRFFILLVFSIGFVSPFFVIDCFGVQKRLGSVSAALSAKSIEKLLKIEPFWVKMAAKGTYKSLNWLKTI